MEKVMKVKIEFELDNELGRDDSWIDRLTYMLRVFGAKAGSMVLSDRGETKRLRFDEAGRLIVEEGGEARPQVAVVIEDDAVTCIVSDRPNEVFADFFVIDYTTDGADPEDLIDVPQPDGTLVAAYTRYERLEDAGIDLDAVNATMRGV